MLSISVKTSDKTEVVNVTQMLAELVVNVRDGLAFFSLPHTSAALVISEDDAELRDDFIKAAQNLFADMRPFSHIRKNNPNAEAHLLSAFAGASVMMAVENGKLALGTYQSVLLLELDGPKTRTIQCKLITSQKD